MVVVLRVPAILLEAALVFLVETTTPRPEGAASMPTVLSLTRPEYLYEWICVRFPGCVGEEVYESVIQLL